MQTLEPRAWPFPIRLATEMVPRNADLVDGATDSGCSQLWRW